MSKDLIVIKDLPRFVTKVKPPTHLYSCWEWTGHTTPFGYGTFKIGRKMTLAHRYSYNYFIGVIPEGLNLDHLCSNPSCVNPIHLEPVTQAENNKRSIRRKKGVEPTSFYR